MREPKVWYCVRDSRGWYLSADLKSTGLNVTFVDSPWLAYRFDTAEEAARFAPQMSGTVAVWSV